MWVVVLLLSYIASFFGYLPIEFNALIIFIFGILFFYIGSYLANSFVCIKNSPDNIYNTVKCISNSKWLYYVLFVGFIVCIFEVLEFSEAAAGFSEMAYYVRNVTTNENPQELPFFLRNYLFLSNFLLPIFLINVFFHQSKCKLSLLFSSIFLVLELYVSGRSGLLTKAIVFTFLLIQLHYKMTFKRVVVALFLVLTMLVWGAIITNKIDIDNDQIAFFQSFIRTTANYILQGPILFSVYYNNSEAFTPTWDSLILLKSIVSQSNTSLEIVHQQFSCINISCDEGNVYSIYYAMVPNYGVSFSMLLIAIYGFICTYIYKHRFHNIFFLILAGYLMSFCVLSPFSDMFGSGMYFILKLFVVSLLFKIIYEKNSSFNPR